MSVAIAAYRSLTGRDPDGVWTAPGRVTLVGEHTDYNDGLVLPLAIDRSTTVAVGRRSDSLVRVASGLMPDVVTMALDDVSPGRVAGWAAYPLGVVWALRRTGIAMSGADIAIGSDLPVRSGLASSAALEVAIALALLDLAGQTLSQEDIARCCQAGEEAVAGAPTGLMDPLVALTGRAGHALFLDCRTLERALVPCSPAAASARLLVIDTGVAHSTSGAGYRARREECAQAAAELGVRSLHDASAGDIDERLTGVLQRRARHVAGENERVLRTVEMLLAGHMEDVGAVLDESHASLRDDYEVSCAELDWAVEAARDAGAWGARMTGAGFGGSAIALVPSDGGDAVSDAARDAFARHGRRAPHVFAVTAADGARRVT